MSCRVRCPELAPYGLTTLCAALACALLPAVVRAEGLRVEPNIAATLLWSSNTDLGQSTRERSDFIVDVRPALRITGDDPKLKLNGTVGLTSTTYVNGTQSDAIAPQVQLGMDATLVDRLLFLAAGVRSYQANDDLFGLRTSSASTVNRYTTTEYAVSPYIDRELSPSLRFTLRSDNVWVRNSGETVSYDDAYYMHDTIALAKRPEPLGASLEAEHDGTKYRDRPETLTSDIGRVVVTLAVDAQYQFSAIGGYERVDMGFGLPEESGRIYGGRFAWRPTDRTSLSATVEHRFFGNGWEALFSHRSPFLAWNLRTQRQVSSYAQRLFSSPAGGNIATLLDQAFTTRFPDPVERQQVVQEFIDQRGLSTTSQEALNMYSDRLDLYTLVSGSVAYIGPREAVSLTLYRSRTETLQGSDPIVSLLFPADADQRGATLEWSHRVTRESALIGSLGWLDAKGFNLNAGQDSKQRLYRLEYNQVLSPRTTGLLGARHTTFDSTVYPDGTESALYVGLAHRF